MNFRKSTAYQQIKSQQLELNHSSKHVSDQHKRYYFLLRFIIINKSPNQYPPHLACCKTTRYYTSYLLPKNNKKVHMPSVIGSKSQ